MVTLLDVYKEIHQLQLDGVTSQRQEAKMLGIFRNADKQYWNRNAVTSEEVFIMPEIHCNICGRALDDYDKKCHFSIHQKIGYGSAYDGKTLKLDLCCICMDILIRSCAITPLVEQKDEEKNEKE